MDANAYVVVVRPLPPEEGGGYLALVPDLHGCMSDGATEAEAIANVRLAIGEWADEMKRLRRKVPAPGAVIRAVNAERTSSLDLIKKQKELIEVQRKLLKEKAANVQRLERQVENLERELNALIASADSDGCQDDWFRVAARPVAIAVASRKVVVAH